MSNRIDQNPKKYGYARVSSKSQEANSSLESQKQLLIQNVIEEQNILVEVVSAADEIKNRPVVQKLMNEKLQENDLIMVTKIDRCSRNTLVFLKLQDLFFKRNITFVALDLPTSFDLATNKLIVTTLSSMAEFENNRRQERQKQGIINFHRLSHYTENLQKHDLYRLPNLLLIYLSELFYQPYQLLPHLPIQLHLYHEEYHK